MTKAEKCIELRISDEDIGSVEHKQHGHGFLHKHHHHVHSKQYDSSKWTEEDEKHSGLMSKSQVSTIINAGVLLPDTKTISITERNSDQDVSISVNGNNRRASTTEERRNPFAVREGNSFAWQDVNMTLVSCT